MKRLAIILALCAVPVAASAAVAPAASTRGTAVAADQKVRVADYYKGKKHCYTRGSSTICN